MSLVQRAPSAPRLLGGALLAAAVAIAAPLVLTPTPRRHDLAVAGSVLAPDGLETRRPGPSQGSAPTVSAPAPAPPVAVDDIALNFPLSSPIVAVAHSDHGTYLAGAD